MFDHITVSDGLSQNSVESILQDACGYLWIATQDGLNRYDGYSFTIFRTHTVDAAGESARHGLTDNTVWALFEDSDGVLWVGTANGLNRFNRATETFSHFQHQTDNERSLSHPSVRALFEDSHGDFWVGTARGGLNRLDRSTGLFTPFRHDPDDKTTLSSDRISSIAEDAHGVLWVGTEDAGINRFDREHGTFSRFQHDPMDARSLSSDAVTRVVVDSHGTLWVATDGGGLNRRDADSASFTRYMHDARDSGSISSNHLRTVYEDSRGRLWTGHVRGGGVSLFDRTADSFSRFTSRDRLCHSLNDDFVLTIYEDRGGIIWIGTHVGGLNRFDSHKTRFELYRNESRNENSLNNNTVRSFYRDNQTLYIGTEGGLNALDLVSAEFTHYTHDPNCPNSLPDNTVRSLHPDGNGNLWIATHGGLSRFDLAKRTFTNFLHDPQDPDSISSNAVWRVFVDSYGLVWVGTRDALNVLNPDSGRVDRFVHDPSDARTIAGDRILAIFEDRDRNMWFSTVTTGVNRYDRATGVFTNFTHDSTDAHSLSHHTVFSIAEDRDGNLWMGTRGGLNKLDRQSWRFSHYREADGLPNDVIYGLLIDDEDNIWMSTNRGISKFDPIRETFTNYSSSDGLQSEEFNNGAFYQSPDGQMYFGGVNGFNSFHPKTVSESTYDPDVVITRFEVLNEEVVIGSACPDTLAVELSHDENYLSFEFASLDFSSPERNQYAYRLEGFDEDWIHSGSRRYANYTNLPPGRFTFRVRGTNSDGRWSSHVATVSIRIAPALWQTAWFRAMIAVGMVLFIGGVYRFKTVHMRRRSSELELAVEERTERLKRTNESLEQEIEHRKLAEEEIRRIAYHDYLTGLPNRRLFTHLCEQEIADSKRNGRTLAILFVDLDRFKVINDTHGHDAGDAVLIQVATRITSMMRESDVICRIGGDEFVLLLRDARDCHAVETVAKKMIEAIEVPVEVSQTLSVQIGASIGASFFPADDDQLTGLIAKADEAMYQAKQGAKDRFSFFDQAACPQ